MSASRRALISATLPKSPRFYVSRESTSYAIVWDERANAKPFPSALAADRWLKALGHSGVGVAIEALA